MRIVLFLATFTAVSYLGEATFCPKKCSRDVYQPVVGCIYRCRGILLGTYYDGTPCYILRRIGKRFDWIGNCTKGICIKWGPRRHDSPALRNCYHRSTSQALPTSTISFESATIPEVPTEVQEPGKPNSEFTPSQPPTETANPGGSSNASISTAEASETVSSTTQVTTREPESPIDNNQPPSEANSSPPTHDQSASPTSESEAGPSEETTESTIATRTYGPREPWVNWRFTTTTVSPETNATIEGTVSPTPARAC